MEWSRGHFLLEVPASWRSAQIVAIPKKEKPPSELSSYRPISLLSSISKLAERLVQALCESCPVLCRDMLPSPMHILPGCPLGGSAPAVAIQSPLSRRRVWFGPSKATRTWRSRQGPRESTPPQ